MPKQSTAVKQIEKKKKQQNLKSLWNEGHMGDEKDESQGPAAILISTLFLCFDCWDKIKYSAPCREIGSTQRTSAEKETNELWVQKCKTK